MSEGTGDAATSTSGATSPEPQQPEPQQPEPQQSDKAAPPEKTLGRRALDLFVFAPAGVVLTAMEEFPDLASKGRARLEGQVSNARVMGQFAVAKGQRDLKKRFGFLNRPAGPAPAPASSARPEADAARPLDRAEPGPAPFNGTTGSLSEPLDTLIDDDVVQGTFSRPEAPDSVDTAISGYDTLSASQVVRRLEGLNSAELEAVYHHESTTRSRRTILHRVQQLLGAEGVPGATSPPN